MCCFRGSSSVGGLPGVDTYRVSGMGLRCRVWGLGVEGLGFRLQRGLRLTHEALYAPPSTPAKPYQDPNETSTLYPWADLQTLAIDGLNQKN